MTDGDSATAVAFETSGVEELAWVLGPRKVLNHDAFLFKDHVNTTNVAMMSGSVRSVAVTTLLDLGRATKQPDYFFGPDGVTV